MDSLLFSLNKRLNDKTFRYHEKYPEKKIGFHAYHERVNNNAHSNIILKVPPEYDVLNVVLDMEKLWTKLDERKNPKFKLYYDLDVRDQSKCTNYARKKVIMYQSKMLKRTNKYKNKKKSKSKRK